LCTMHKVLLLVCLQQLKSNIHSLRAWHVWVKKAIIFPHAKCQAAARPISLAHQKLGIGCMVCPTPTSERNWSNSIDYSYTNQVRPNHTPARLCLLAWLIEGAALKYQGVWDL